MLKSIPTVLSPELMMILMEMGHGDELVLADGNFPAVTCGKRLIRCDGLAIPELLDAILLFFPLDNKVEAPVSLMALGADDSFVPVIWDEYKNIVQKHEAVNNKFEYMERFAFYERAKQAFAVVATSEQALCGNIILKKGVMIARPCSVV